MSGEIQVRVHSFGTNRNLSMVYHDPITGKKIARSAGTRDEKEALRRAAVWEAELREGRYTAPSKITWQEFRERHETERLDALAPNTRKVCDSALDWLERLVSPDRLEKVTAAVLSRFAGQLRAKGLGDVSIGAYLGHLRAAFRWAESVGMIREAPRVNMPRRAKRRKFMKGRPITGEEFDRMILTVPKTRPSDPEQWERLLTALWLSGLRLGEALALSWDPDAPLCVCLAGRRPALRIRAEAQKSNRDEILPITPDFAEFLLTTPEAGRSAPVLAPRGLLSGKPIVPERVGAMISKIGKKAGVVVNRESTPRGETVKYASAHDLRRAFGTRWASRVKPAILQRLMRHADIQTTLKFYVALDSDDVADELWSQWGSDTTATNPPEAGPGNIIGNIAPIGPQKTEKQSQ